MHSYNTHKGIDILAAVIADLQVFVRTFVMYPAYLYKICSNPLPDKEKEIMCML